MEFCPATSQEKSRSFAKREVDYNSIRPLHFGRGDQIWLVVNQTLSHFDRNVVKRRNLNKLNIRIRFLHVGQNDMACIKLTNVGDMEL